MIRDALLIAKKDVRVEISSRVIFGQVLPFSLLILILFGLAISSDLIVTGDAKRTVLEQVSPGLFWLAIVFSSLFAVNRSFKIESDNGNLDALRMAGIDPAAIFLGKALAISLLIFILDLFVGALAVVIFNASIIDFSILGVTVFAATISISMSGTLYAGITAGSRSKDTLMPLLLLPTMAPMLLIATRSTEAALFSEDQTGWGWPMLLSVLAFLYTGIGMLSFGALMEES